MMVEAEVKVLWIRYHFRLSQKGKEEGGEKYDPLASLKFSPTCSHAFTQHGAIMLAAVLNAPRAIEVRVFAVTELPELRPLRY